jgi:hypothetical protein
MFLLFICHVNSTDYELNVDLAFCLFELHWQPVNVENSICTF